MRKRGIKYLRRLVECYCIFTKWKGVLVIEESDTVHVIWISPRMLRSGNRQNIEYATSVRTFPKSDLPQRIKSYQQKINYEFKNRIKQKEL